MFRSTLVLLSLFSAILASPVSTPGGVSVSLSVEEPKVPTVDKIALVAKVTNNGDKEVRFLKYDTVLDELPTQSFTVTTKDGKEIPFTGVRLSVDVLDAPEEAFVVIHPGESVSATHHLGSLYDFESAGVGSFVFTPETKIVVFDDLPAGGNGTASPTFKDVETETPSVEVEVTDSVKNPVDPEKRAVVVCANAQKATIIRAVYNEAKMLATLAYNWLPGRANDPLYRAYWKNNVLVTVRQRFQSIRLENVATRRLGCVDTANACVAGVRAYAYNAFPNNIVFCPYFFTIRVPATSLCTGTPVDARRVGGGIGIHELSHAVLGTRDHAYGCPNNQALDAYRQLRNADNYHCFTAQLYKNTRC